MLRKYFVNGVITIVPIGIVIWVVVQLFNFFDNILGSQITTIDHHYIPGLGLLLTVILITIAGALTTHWFSRTLFTAVDMLLKRVPFVKSLYGIVKDTVESFVGQRQAFQKVVLLHLPGSDVEVIGFLSRSEGLEAFALGDDGQPAEEKVAVFVPLSFQMAGMTLLVPKSRLKILDIPVEEGVKFVFSGGLSRSEEAQPEGVARTLFHLFSDKKSPPLI
ncbi:DUF502 domain-containing protein [Sulfoacidibacillus thermotolerans]|uniref:DUF502 domain-containing protein n=1 Tax=Sulfoacidibacillus thermotolerans TaxID=1765684 RepID=A0A2U3DC83_SULT2|nr:DUF502 domain-containing protein [Sulfoacidibacillus thermotolerans]PWI58897.1 hypothetical protein BM613_02090 [Sulfoacidibacillus thermotolerans]